MRVGLVGSVKTKMSSPRAARDLYDSKLFRGRRAYVEATCDRWLVLSAKYGLVGPDDVIAPYEETLKSKSAEARRTWTALVLDQIDRLEIVYADSVFEIHAGGEYCNHGLVDGLQGRGAKVDVPTAHLSLGHQLAFYAQASSRKLSAR